MSSLLKCNVCSMGYWSGRPAAYPARLRKPRAIGRRGSNKVPQRIRAENKNVAEDIPKEQEQQENSVNEVETIRKVTSEELEVAIQNRDRHMVVDFYASWCGPCVLMNDELKKVAAQLGDKVEILKIDTEENAQLSSDLKIQGLPTLMFISTDPSKPALRVEGLVPANTVKDIIENEL